jgi:hypothetical protein
MKLISFYLLTVLLIAFAGCTTGIRNLTEREQVYFKGLENELKKSEEKFKDHLASNLALNEEIALKEISRFEDKMIMSNMVYSVREVLKAPKSDRAQFIQVTRNKVILYHLAEVAAARNKNFAAQLAVANERPTQIMANFSELKTLVNKAIISNEVLYNHLNKSVTSQLLDVLAEVGRQVDSFNQKIEKADQENVAINRLTEAGKKAENRVDQAKDGLLKFNDVWIKLNKK